MRILLGLFYLVVGIHNIIIVILRRSYSNNLSLNLFCYNKFK